MKNAILFLMHVALVAPFFGQGRVGINTTTPTEGLEVNGSFYTNKLYLRNPGEATETGGNFIASSLNALDVYDPVKQKDGIFNYIKLSLTGVSKNGVTDYDTKIDVNKYHLVIHNYAIKLNDGSTQVAADYAGNGSNDNKQGSPEFVAFKSNGTWHLKGGVSASVLINKKQSNMVTAYNNFTIEFYMFAYHKMLTKFNVPGQNANLNTTDGSTQTLSTPPGF